MRTNFLERAGWARRALAPLAAAHARRRDAARLAGLPDHLLLDIGLTRDAVRRGRAFDPR